MSKPAIAAVVILIVYAVLATERWWHWRQTTLVWQGQYMRLQHMEDDAVQQVIKLTQQVEELKRAK